LRLHTTTKQERNNPWQSSSPSPTRRNWACPITPAIPARSAVDQEIQQVGFMPDATVYGMNRSENENGNGNGHHAGSNGTSGTNCTNGTNGTPPRGYRSTRPVGNGDAWNCTEGQQGFIIRLVNESNLKKEDVEAMARHDAGLPVDRGTPRKDREEKE
jgi:hypothetical protein